MSDSGGFTAGDSAARCPYQPRSGPDGRVGTNLVPGNEVTVAG